MPLAFDHLTRVITIPQNYLTPLSGNNYELDTNQLRLDVIDYMDSEEGMSLPDVIRHNTQVTLAGITFARTIEFINGWTITFEPGTYSVSLTNSNNNIADVMNLNGVSLRSANSAGLIVTGAGDPDEVADAVGARVIEGSLTADEVLRLMAAVLYGKVSGAGTATIHFRDTGDSKDRVLANVDSEGNRTNVTLDPA